ncbi:MAG: hypothetical protein ACLQJ0_22100 [Steroidobacteraceae bacterium]|jgi:hypothetical protein
MVVIPGLSESLSAVGKQIIRFNTTATLLSVEAASSVNLWPVSAASERRCVICTL